MTDPRDPWAALREVAAREEAAEREAVAAREDVVWRQAASDRHAANMREARADLDARDPALRAKPGKRVRIVLAERQHSRRVVRTLADVEEQTGVGEVLVRQLVREQLLLALRLALVTVVALAAVPLLFWLAPRAIDLEVLGVPLPWTVLGAAVYPLLIGVAWVYNRSAERNEQDFSDYVEN